MIGYLSCDLCGADKPRYLLDSPGLDGPLVQCAKCGLRYVGARKSSLTFGTDPAKEIADNVRHANIGFKNLRLEEEHRLALLNARWRLALIRQIKPAGTLLEIGCARGDFLRVAREHFEVKGVEPNPELAKSAAEVAPVHRDIIENTPWIGFDVIAGFHVIEHVDSPSRFIGAAAERLKPDGLLVIETPNIDAMPFKVFGRKWRQFIPEHYFFFDPTTMERLLGRHGLKIDRMATIGKHASVELILNRFSRYLPWTPSAGPFSRLTFRVNPRDIMLVFASRRSS